MYLHESTYWGHYFYVSDLRRDSQFAWSSEPREGLVACTQCKGSNLKQNWMQGWHYGKGLIYQKLWIVSGLLSVF